MGYYTNYTLLEDDSELLSDMFFSGFRNIDTKWYTFDKDIEDFAKANPKARAVISGEGEDHGDIWKAFVYDGKVERVMAKITIEPPSDWIRF